MNREDAIAKQLEQNDDVEGVMVIEDGSVVSKSGNIQDSLAPHFVRLVNVGLSSQLVEGEEFQTLNVNYPYKLNYTIAVAGKKIYVTKRKLKSASDDEEEDGN